MALSFEELSQPRTVIREAKRGEVVAALQNAKSEALRVSNLIADPNWEIFCRYAERLQGEYEQRAERAKEKLLNDTLAGPQVMVDYKSHLNFALGIKTTLTIAKTIVEQGEKAVEQLKLLKE